MSISDIANPSMLSWSRLVVGSSSANSPQLRQNVSARASRINIEASIFCPALHRPRMSSSVCPLSMTTWECVCI